MTFAWGTNTENRKYHILSKMIKLPFENNDLPFYVGAIKDISKALTKSHF